MKISTRIGVLALLAAGVGGCSGGDADFDAEGASLAEEEQAIIGPLAFISEEAPNNKALCGLTPLNVGIGSALCTGKRCDNIQLTCRALPPGVGVAGYENIDTRPYGPVLAIGWTSYISEENGRNQVSCESQGPGSGVDGIIDGMRITGGYADNISLHCRRYFPTPRSIDCFWTGYFSEEHGLNNFPAGYFAAGVACTGANCDNMAYRVCRATP